jgi:hypothetical protein
LNYLKKRLTVTDHDSSSSKPAEAQRGPAPNRERGHRPNQSNEAPQFRKGPNGLLIPVRPKDRHSTAESIRSERRVRRNSDPSSIRDSMTPEEREARDKRRRERASRHGRDRSRDSKMTDITIVAQPSGSSRRRRSNKHVDVVDKLDVTGLYGVGGSK